MRYHETPRSSSYAGNSRPEFTGSRFNATYDGPIITDRVRRELLDAIDKKHDWRAPRNY